MISNDLSAVNRNRGQVPEGLSVRKYLFRQHLICIFVVGYIIASQYGPRLGRAEFYPFFNWELFSYTDSIRRDIVLRVHSINGEDLEEPTMYFSVPNHFSRTQGEKIRLRKLLLDLWQHYRQGDRERVAKFLDVVRDRYFSEVGAAEYEVSLIQYNPIERFRTGKFEVSRTILRASK